MVFMTLRDTRIAEMSLVEMTPEQLVKRVIKSGAKTLAYTYNEPLIWHEWILDTTKIA